MNTENDIRRAIMRRTDLNAGAKLTLLAVLLRVDWQTWAGPCTVNDLAQLAGISPRTVRYGLKRADELGLINRAWGTVAGQALPMISVNTENLHSPANIAPPAESATVAISAPPAKLAPPANTAPLPLQDLPTPPCNPCTPTPANIAPLQPTTNYQPITQPILTEVVAGRGEDNFSFDGETDEQASDETTPTRLNKWHKLTAEQIQIIETHCTFKTGFYERCKVARKYLNIRLHRGGYYEQL